MSSHPPQITLYDPAAQLSAAQSPDRVPSFRALAYSGAPIRQPWTDAAVVVDLSAFQPPDQPIPVRLAHRDDAGLGHTTRLWVDDEGLHAEGLLSRATEAARDVAESARRGFPWRVSIGAAIHAIEHLPLDQTAQVNGRIIRGPAEIVRKWTLNEISFVDLPADPETHADIAAKGAPRMTADPNPNTHDAPPAPPAQTPAQQSAPTDPAALIRAQAAEETQRIAEIRRIAAEQPDIATRAIREGWDVGRTALEVLRATRPAPAIQTYDATTSTDLLAAAALLSARVPEEHVARTYGAQTVDVARRRWRRPLGLYELILEAAWANGYTGRSTRDLRTIMRYAFQPEICAGGYSTVDLPTIFNSTANKFMLDGFNSVERTWRNVCAVRSVRDFKAVTSYRLIGKDQYELVPPGGQLKHGTLAERAYSNKADTYGLMLTISREDIVNDDLDALSQIPRKLGAGAGRKLNQVFWTKFLDDSTFFTTGNGNLLTGPTSALNLDGLTQAVVTFSQLKDPDGQFIGTMPIILLVPSSLQAIAAQLFNSTEIRDTSTNARYPVTNPHAGKYRPEVSRYLDAGSTTAWYLMADPQELAAIEVAFLNGQEAPTIETTDADFATLGIVMRGYHDFGVALQEPKAAVKSTGA